MPEKLKIALAGAYPASGNLPDADIRPAYRNREHPVPWVRALARAYAERDDIEFRIFTHSRAVSRMQRTDHDGIDITYIPKREPLRSDPYHLFWPGTFALRSRIREYRPRLVHGFGAEHGYGLIAARTGLPSVLFIQGIAEKVCPLLNQPQLYKFLKKKIERASVRRCTGIVAETAFARDWALSVKPAAQVKIIPHGLNAEFTDVQPDFARKLALCIGSVDFKKGAEQVAEAFFRVASACPDAECMFIGSGTMKDALAARAREKGLGERILFPGSMPHQDIIQLMKHARVVVTGSRMDTSPNVITESHSAGLPFIGTAVGGIPEMIEEGRDGFVVPLNDPPTMAERILTLLRDPDRCRAMGAAGRAKVLELNRPSKIAQAHIDFYREVLASAEH